MEDHMHRNAQVRLGKLSQIEIGDAETKRVKQHLLSMLGLRWKHPHQLETNKERIYHKEEKRRSKSDLSVDFLTLLTPNDSKKRHTSTTNSEHCNIES